MFILADLIPIIGSILYVLRIDPLGFDLTPLYISIAAVIYTVTAFVSGSWTSYQWLIRPRYKTIRTGCGTESSNANY
jgi:hypothetical protein